MNKEFFLQLLKYGVVGVINTLLTALTIWIILRFGYGIGEEAGASSSEMFVANLLGYVVGIVNSFLFNRNWTFKSKSSWKTGFLKFLLAFAVCYSIQLLIVIGLNESMIIPSVALFGYRILSAYICQFIGIVVYTLSNFLLNKYYTFNEKTVSET